MKLQNWLGGGSIPRDHANNINNNAASLRITTVSAGPSPMMTSRHHARPVQVRSPTLSKTSRDSYGSGRYSSNGELSPTKRLLEMGIHTSSIDHAVQADLAAAAASAAAAATGNGNNIEDNKTESRSSSSRSNKKLSPSIIQMYANIQDQDDQHHLHHPQ